MMKFKARPKEFVEAIRLNFIKKRLAFFNVFSIALEVFLIFNSCFLIYLIWKIDLSRMPNAFSLFFLIAAKIFATIAILSFTFIGWISKNDQFKLFRKMFLTVLFIIIFAFPSAYLILYIGQALSKTQGVQIGSADGWLGFIGSLFGGLITMLAVLFTFQYQKYLDTMKSIPTLSIKLIDDKHKFNVKVVDLDNVMLIDSIRFEIKNNSKHIAKDFKITGINFRSMSSNKTVNEREKELEEFIKSSMTESILNPEQSMTFPLLLNQNIKDDVFYILMIEGEYYDFLKFKKFSYSIMCFMNIALESDYRMNLPNFIGKHIPCKFELVSTKFKILNH